MCAWQRTQLLPAMVQPPSGWTCVRPAANQAPAGYETATVRRDACAPSSEPSPCRLRSSRRQDGRVSTRRSPDHQTLRHPHRQTEPTHPAATTPTAPPPTALLPQGPTSTGTRATRAQKATPPQTHWAVRAPPTTQPPAPQCRHPHQLDATPPASYDPRPKPGSCHQPHNRQNAGHPRRHQHQQARPTRPEAATPRAPPPPTPPPPRKAPLAQAPTPTKHRTQGTLPDTARTNTHTPIRTPQCGRPRRPDATPPADNEPRPKPGGLRQPRARRSPNRHARRHPHQQTQPTHPTTAAPPTPPPPAPPPPPRGHTTADNHTQTSQTPHHPPATAPGTNPGATTRPHTRRNRRHSARQGQRQRTHSTRSTGAPPAQTPTPPKHRTHPIPRQTEHPIQHRPRQHPRPNADTRTSWTPHGPPATTPGPNQGTTTSHTTGGAQTNLPDDARINNPIPHAPRQPLRRHHHCQHPPPPQEPHRRRHQHHQSSEHGTPLPRHTGHPHPPPPTPTPTPRRGHPLQPGATPPAGYDPWSKPRSRHQPHTQQSPDHHPPRHPQQDTHPTRRTVAVPPTPPPPAPPPPPPGAPPAQAPTSPKHRAQPSPGTRGTPPTTATTPTPTSQCGHPHQPDATPPAGCNPPGSNQGATTSHTPNEAQTAKPGDALINRPNLHAPLQPRHGHPRETHRAPRPQRHPHHVANALTGRTPHHPPATTPGPNPGATTSHTTSAAQAYTPDDTRINKPIPHAPLRPRNQHHHH